MALGAAIPLCTPYIADYDLAILVIPLAYLALDARRTSFTKGRTLILLMIWGVNPSLWWISKAVGWQIGPVAFATLLAYAAWLARQSADSAGIRPQ